MLKEGIKADRTDAEPAEVLKLKLITVVTAPAEVTIGVVVIDTIGGGGGIKALTITLPGVGW